MQAGLPFAPASVSFRFASPLEGALLAQELMDPEFL